MTKMTLTCAYGVDVVCLFQWSSSLATKPLVPPLYGMVVRRLFHGNATFSRS